MRGKVTAVEDDGSIVGVLVESNGLRQWVAIEAREWAAILAERGGLEKVKREEVRVRGSAAAAVLEFLTPPPG